MVRLGKALTLRRDFEGAVSHHEEAIRYNPRRADLHHELGVTLRKSKLPGHHDAAVAASGRASSAAGSSASSASTVDTRCVKRA